MSRRTATVVAAVLALVALTGAVAPAAATGGTSSPASPASATPAASAAQSDCSFPVTVTDATGTEVTLEESPERVVVTAPSAAQTIWELGEQERVVGMPVTPFTAYLPGSENRTHVMDESGVAPDREQVVDLQPDLVIVPGAVSEEAVEAMREVGLTVYYEAEPGSISDVQENVETTGRLLGACGAADETVNWMDDRVSAVEDAVADEEHPTLYYWVGEGFTAPPGSFQHDLIERAGARNAAADLEMEDWMLADQEGIVDVDPEYLLLTEGTPVPDSEAIQSTTAVQEDDVIRVNGTYWNQNAPRIVLALEQVAAQLHPEAAEDAGLSQEPAPREDPGAAGGDSIPGLGVGAAVAALLALAAVLVARGA